MIYKAQQFELEPDKISWSKAYLSKPYKATIAWSLVSFGMEEIRRATILKKLSVVKAAIENNERGHHDPSIEAQIHELMWAQLTDDFLICTFFENSMKAMLLWKGAIIHRFKEGPTNGALIKELTKLQRKQPLGVECISAKNLVDADFQRNTIGMELLLTPNYQKVIGLATELCQALTLINERRNALHFHNLVTFTISPTMVQQYCLIIAEMKKWEWELQRNAALSAQ